MHATAVFMAILGLGTTSLAAPTSAPAHEVAVEKRFKSGLCGVHVHIQRGWERYQADVKVFDADHNVVAEQAFRAKGNVISGKIGGNGLPNELEIHVTNGDENPATFVYGDEHWESGQSGTKNDRCSVGEWDHKAHWPNRNTVDMDCGFPC
ncbi:hypothetical protein PG997_013546 [Apiospora hydei]|uniref:Uncharacterized protein n=1 Tax=Apiospora hydei TaxID=1337664 RepID=A0ABR1V9R4_9PEZI